MAFEMEDVIRMETKAKKNLYVRRKMPRYYFEHPPFEKHEVLGVKVISNIAKFVSEMRYYSASQFTNPSNCPVSFGIEKEGDRSRGLRLSGHSKFLFDLYTEYKSKSEGYNQFFDIIGPDGIGLINKIDFQEILTSSIDYSVRSGGKVRKRKREKMLVIPQFIVGRHELSPNQYRKAHLKQLRYCSIS